MAACKVCYKNLARIVDSRKHWTCPKADCPHKKIEEPVDKPADPALLKRAAPAPGGGGS